MSENEKVDDDQNDKSNDVAVKHDGDDDKPNATSNNDNDKPEERQNDTDKDGADSSKANEQVVVCQVNRGADLED